MKGDKLIKIPPRKYIENKHMKEKQKGRKQGINSLQRKQCMETVTL